MSTIEKNKAIARRWLHLINEGNGAPGLDRYPPSWISSSPGCGRPLENSPAQSSGPCQPRHDSFYSRTAPIKALSGRKSRPPQPRNDHIAGHSTELVWGAGVAGSNPVAPI